MTRWIFYGWLAVFGCCLTAVDSQAAFGLEDVSTLAANRASRPYAPPEDAAASLSSLNYDDYRRIRFRESKALWRDLGVPFRVQFFHAGGGFNAAVRINEVVEGSAYPVSVSRDAFDGDGLVLPEKASVVGLRILHPLHGPERWDEVLAVLGASYFRALGVGQGYGASARALSVDTAGATAEEFPRHVEFWLERPLPDAMALTLYALVDGPRVTGAYRYTVRPGITTTVDVDARLFLRGHVSALGFAPITSMFLAGENQPASGDFRPEVHDSDGLQIASADGEWLWRPLTNPAGVFVTSFQLTSPRGFGLMQRDRNFASYEDLEARYERRPSVWVEPVGGWGPGRVELLQFRTPDETHDNIAAYWISDTAAIPGQPVERSWRLHWAASLAPRPPGSMTLQTRRGHGWRRIPPSPAEIQLQVDFDSPTATAASRSDLSAEATARSVETDVDAVATGNGNVRALRARAQPHGARGGWRMTIDFERIDDRQAVELRAYLRRGEQVLSETWTYAMAPER